MTDVVWLGEAETPDLEETVRFGLVFKKGETVEVKDPRYVDKLKANKNFEVGPEAEKDEEPSVPVFTPPSEHPAQFPVPKAGDPVSEFTRPPASVRAVPKAVKKGA